MISNSRPAPVPRAARHAGCVVVGAALSVVALHLRASLMQPPARPQLPQLLRFNLRYKEPGQGAMMAGLILQRPGICRLRAALCGDGYTTIDERAALGAD